MDIEPRLDFLRQIEETCAKALEDGAGDEPPRGSAELTDDDVAELVDESGRYHVGGPGRPTFEPPPKDPEQPSPPSE